MKFDRNILISMLQFIESNLEFEKSEGLAPYDFNIKGVYLKDFVKTYPNYKIDEVKYVYYLLKNSEYLVIDSQNCSESPCVKGFAEKGIEMLLKDLHR